MIWSSHQVALSDLMAKKNPYCDSISISYITDNEIRNFQYGLLSNALFVSVKDRTMILHKRSFAGERPFCF